MEESRNDDLLALHEPLKAPVVEIVDISPKERTAEPESGRAASISESLDGVNDTSLNDEVEEGEEESGWEDDDDLSLYEELMNGVGDEGELGQDTDAFTPEESETLRKRLRLVGENGFLRDTVEAGITTAKKLCTAFGVRPPFFLEGGPDQAYYPLLSLCISRELQKRVKLSQWNTVEDAVELLKKAQNIVILTGAGISTSLGIPDFRSKDTGLYARLEHLGLSDPQEVFDIHLFREDPTIFYSVAKDILPSSSKFTPTHAFIRLLQDRGKLLTNYTQNIDNLEEFAGIEKEKLVQCHGSFATATCMECAHQVEGRDIYNDLKAGKVAHCDECYKSIRLAKPGLKRKRSSDFSDSKPKKKKKQDYLDSTDEDDDDIAVAGIMKPDITFFGEDLPARFHERLTKHDRELVDLVIVIGTSLKVAPVSEVVGVIPTDVPQIYISREPCNHVDFDIDLLGDCDTVVTELCRRADWELKHGMVSSVPIDAQLQEGYESRFLIKPKVDAEKEKEGMIFGIEKKVRELPDEMQIMSVPGLKA